MFCINLIQITTVCWCDFIFIIFEKYYFLSYIAPSLKACRLNDPELGECIKKSGTNGIKEFSKGDVERGIPVLDPIELKKVKPLNGGTLNMLLKNIKVFKTGDLKFTKFM